MTQELIEEQLSFKTGAGEHGIIFSAPMVRAILERRKTVTRRLVTVGVVGEKTKSLPAEPLWADAGDGTLLFFDNSGIPWPATSVLTCPYGNVGDTVWVRETWAYSPGTTDAERQLVYRATCDEYPPGWPGYRGSFHAWCVWKSPRFMPRWASRLSLRVVETSIERLHAIGDDDLAAEALTEESVSRLRGGDKALERAKRERAWQALSARELFSVGWNTLHPNRNERGGWDDNPWVWRVKFARVETAS